MCKGDRMQVHLVDGTYELFRQHFGAMRSGGEPSPVAATVGVVRSTMALLDDGATHLGVATDHEIESFRNQLWAGYKTGEDLPPELLEQIPALEHALTELGVTVWPTVEFEADDALGAAAAVAERDERVQQALIVTPDKDLAQCVRGERIVQYDRRKREVIDADGVRAKYGVSPTSIPDYLGLVGDTADGFPGLPGWGAKSAAAVLDRYGHLEDIPEAVGQWDVTGLRGAAKLSATLREQWDLALLFRRIATVDTSVPVGSVDDWHWAGPRSGFASVMSDLGAPELADRAERLAAARAPR